MISNVIDPDGFRINVGIILTDQSSSRLFWGRRVGQDAWQFPQGGINENETIEQALFRELHEEVGLKDKDVEIVSQTKDWLRYLLPSRLVRNDSYPLCVGQKQKWFLLKLTSSEDNIKLEENIKPEFDAWRWVNYWYPLQQVISFKREVYRQALLEFAPQVLNLKRYDINKLTAPCGNSNYLDPLF